MARPKEITEKEKMFCEAYCSNGFDRRSAIDEAGLKSDNASALGAAMLKRPVVIEYISQILEKKRNQFFVTEMDILEGLYKEARLAKKDGGTQQGRIQAWTQIGKHLGMFDSKVKELQSQNRGGGTTINIMNYNVPDKENIGKKEKDITPKPEQLKEEATKVLEGIKIEDYSNKDSEDE